jgi:hypothetical protein
VRFHIRVAHAIPLLTMRGKGVLDQYFAVYKGHKDKRLKHE